MLKLSPVPAKPDKLTILEQGAALSATGPGPGHLFNCEWSAGRLLAPSAELGWEYWPGGPEQAEAGPHVPQTPPSSLAPVQLQAASQKILGTAERKVNSSTGWPGALTPPVSFENHPGAVTQRGPLTRPGAWQLAFTS